MIRIKIWETQLSWNANWSLPVAVRVSKTRVLKIPNTIAAQPRNRVSSRSTNYVFKRDMRASRKAKMGRFLSSMDWPSLFTSFESCEDMLSMFCETIHAGLDVLIQIKKVRVCSSDALWMTQHLKSLILKRQKAFHNKGPNSLQYKLYRNVVNRERKVCKANFYKLKVENMKEKNPWLYIRCGGKKLKDYAEPTNIQAI